jgi:adenylylsulfate kinase-like enzyme
MIIWLIGLSGAGKTVIGKELATTLKAKHDNLVYLDGDILRDVWGDSLGHTVEAREVNAKRISNLCHMLDQQGIHVVATVLSIFPEWQVWNRQNFQQYFEVFIDADLKTLKARDSKGLYAKALAGEIDNVVGIDIPFPRPENPDLILANSVALDEPGALAKNVIEKLPEFKIYNFDISS